MQQPVPASLEPNGASPRTAFQLVVEWRAAPLRVRVLLVFYLAIGAWGGLSGGYLLARELHHPVSYAISFLVLEPVGLCCLVGLAALATPEAWVAGFLSGALGRAKIALFLVAGSLTACIVGVLTWVAWEWLHLQR